MIERLNPELSEISPAERIHGYIFQIRGKILFPVRMIAVQQKSLII
jgi:hypothetical protein